MRVTDKDLNKVMRGEVEVTNSSVVFTLATQKSFLWVHDLAASKGVVEILELLPNHYKLEVSNFGGVITELDYLIIDEIHKVNDIKSLTITPVGVVLNFSTLSSLIEVKEVLVKEDIDFTITINSPKEEEERIFSICLYNYIDEDTPNTYKVVAF